jgi:hypothetical protein
MTEVSSGGAIADHHATPQYRAGIAYLRTLNVRDGSGSTIGRLIGGGHNSAVAL